MRLSVLGYRVLLALLLMVVLIGMLVLFGSKTTEKESGEGILVQNTVERC